MTPEKHKEADKLQREIALIKIKLEQIRDSVKYLFPPPQNKKFLGVKFGEREIEVEYLPPVFMMGYERYSCLSSEYFKCDTHIEIPRDLLEPLLLEMKRRLLLELVSLELKYGGL